MLAASWSLVCNWPPFHGPCEAGLIVGLGRTSVTSLLEPEGFWCFSPAVLALGLGLKGHSWDVAWDQARLLPHGSLTSPSLYPGNSSLAAPRAHVAL